MPKDIEELLPGAIETFSARKLHCAETVLSTMARYWEQDMTHIPRIATAFGGGMASMQRDCGAFTGALMAIGLILGREEGGDRIKAYAAARAFMAWFEGNHSRMCREIVGTDFSDTEQMAQFSAPGGGHETICEPLVAEVCRYLARTIERRGKE